MALSILSIKIYLFANGAFEWKVELSGVASLKFHRLVGSHEGELGYLKVVQIRGVCWCNCILELDQGLWRLNLGKQESPIALSSDFGAYLRLLSCSIFDLLLIGWIIFSRKRFLYVLLFLLVPNVIFLHETQIFNSNIQSILINFLCTNFLNKIKNWYHNWNLHKIFIMRSY